MHIFRLPFHNAVFQTKADIFFMRNFYYQHHSVLQIAACPEALIMLAPLNRAATIIKERYILNKGKHIYLYIENYQP